MRRSEPAHRDAEVQVRLRRRNRRRGDLLGACVKPVVKKRALAGAPISGHGHEQKVLEKARIGEPFHQGAERHYLLRIGQIEPVVSI